MRRHGWHHPQHDVGGRAGVAAHALRRQARHQCLVLDGPHTMRQPSCPQRIQRTAHALRPAVLPYAKPSTAFKRESTASTMPSIAPMRPLPPRPQLPSHTLSTLSNAPACGTLQSPAARAMVNASWKCSGGKPSSGPCASTRASCSQQPSAYDFTNSVVGH
jgi:hypothetical protein